MAFASQTFVTKKTTDLTDFHGPPKIKLQNPCLSVKSVVDEITPVETLLICHQVISIQATPVRDS